MIRAEIEGEIEGKKVVGIGQKPEGERKKARFKAKDKSPQGYLPGVGVLIHDQYRDSKR